MQQFSWLHRFASQKKEYFFALIYIYSDLRGDSWVVWGFKFYNLKIKLKDKNIFLEKNFFLLFRHFLQI